MTDSSVNVKVVVRCRPMNDKEKTRDCKKILKIDERDSTIEISRVAYVDVENGDNGISL